MIVMRALGARFERTSPDEKSGMLPLHQPRVSGGLPRRGFEPLSPALRAVVLPLHHRGRLVVLLWGGGVGGRSVELAGVLDGALAYLLFA
jgi:hypothetical protein